MTPAAAILRTVPVLPSQDIARDVDWYDRHTGFTHVTGDTMYAVLRRGAHELHLQWHAGTASDPLLGGSVVKFFVADIRPLYREFVERGTIDPEKLRLSTDWGTHEFGFYDPNKNAIFFVQDIP